MNNINMTPDANVMSGDELKALLYMTIRGNVKLPVAPVQTQNVEVQNAEVQKREPKRPEPQSLLNREA